MMRRAYSLVFTIALALAGLTLLLLACGWSVPVSHAAPLLQAPANDDFANALVISTLPYSDTQDTTLATTQANDPRFPCIANNPTTNWRQGWHSVWYVYTATVTGALHVDTIGSDYDTVLGVWTGTWGALTNVGCDDDISWPGNPQSSLNISVVSGTTYYVEVAGYRSTASGNLVLSANLVTPPANDDFDSAFVISATPYTYTQDTSLATTAADDPVLSCGSGGQESHSVWYDFTAPGDGSLHVDTSGSGYDTVLAVWTGSRGSLTEADCHDDVSWPGDPTSSVDVAVTAGTTYHIEVVSYGGSPGGPLTLHADSAALKPIYLHHLTAPVTIVDGSSSTEIMDRQQVWGGTTTVSIVNSWYYFYLYPGLAEELVLQGTTHIPLYIEANDSFDANFRARIRDLPPVGPQTNIGTDNTPVPAGIDGWYTLTIPNVSYAVAQGHALVLGLRSNRQVNVYYDSATYDSRVELPTTTYVAVEKVSTRSACHPEGAIYFNQGQTMTITARVSDPFGSYDIAGADVEVTDPDGVAVVPGLAMTPLVTTTGAITYEHIYAIPSTATLGLYTVVVTGTESNGVQATGSTTFSVQSPAVLTSSLTAVPATVNTGQVITVTMAVTNGGQVTATSVAPSALTIGGTGAAVLASGPSPASAGIPGGGTLTFTWVYTATGFGAVNWTGNASGSDANSCAPVSSTTTTSNDALVAPELKMEVGTVSVDSGWVTVNLGNTYDDMVVVCTPNYSNNSIPVVTRLRNASGSSFEVRLRNPSGGTPAAETVHYLVMETGAYTLPSGIRIEAQTYTSTVTDENNSWAGELQTYLQTYTAPVVLGQVMSTNDSDWSVFWDRGSSRTNPPDASNLWTGKTVCEDTDTTRADETVGFVVIEQSYGDIFGMAYEAWLGTDTVRGVGDTPPYSYNFQQPFTATPQVALATMAAVDGNNGGWAVLYGASPLSPNSIDLAIDEDQIGDAERNHTTEQVAYLVFEDPFVVGPVPFLDISKEVDAGGLILPGDTLVYALDYANRGLITATNVVITDQLPSDTIFEDAAPGCVHDGSPTDGLVTCTVGTLGAFESNATAITVTVSGNITANTTLTNTAIIYSAEGVSATTSITTPVTAFNLLKMEVLTVTVDHNWTTVNLNNTYNDMVVVCTPQYANNSRPLVTRVRNDLGSRFEVRLQNPGDSFTPAAETVHCLAIEAGKFTLPDGRQIEAQKYNSTVTDRATSNWNGQAQTYLQTYASPVVLGQVMSFNDANWSVFWDRGSSSGNPPDASNLYTGKAVCEDTDTTRADETVGFVVIEQGNGTVGSVAYEAWLGADTILGVGTLPPYSYNFQQPFDSTPQVALATMAAVDGNNGGWAVLYGANPLSPNSIDLAIDEDQIGDSERNHTTEQVAYLVFEGPLVIRPTHDLHISKVDSPDPALAGGSLVYTVVYTNSGVLTATNTVITETYDSNVSFASANPPPDAGYNNRWTIGDLAGGESRTLIVTVSVNSGLTPGTTLTNTVTIGCDQTGPVSGTETTQVTSFALSLTKSDSPDPVLAGTTLTYTLLYTNAGPADAPDVTITDTLPAGVTYGGVVGQPPGWSDPPAYIPGPPATLTWYTPTLSAGAAGTFVFTVTVNASAGGTITNSAVITNSIPDDNPNDNDDDEPTVIIPLTTTVQFSSASYSVGESAGPATITATLSAASPLTVTVNYATSDGTAAAGSDYTATSGTLTFTPGITSQTFAVPIVADALDENDETVLLTLSNPSNATIGGTNPATLTILDDDPSPTVQFSSASYNVGESAGPATINVSLSAASGLTATVNYATSDGTATAGSDYTATGGTLIFSPGVTSQSFTVPIIPDVLDETDEAVLLTLSAATNATIGGTNPATLTILDDDPQPTVSFGSGSYSVDEGVGSATINVVLSAASGLTATVNYATSDGTAVAGSDYTATSGTLTFPPGVTSQSFLVLITDDGAAEPDETVLLTLSAPSNATVGGTNPATLTITDNDVAPGQVTVDKSVSPSTVETPGQPVTYTYTITIHNAGPSTVHVAQITDTLPAGFTYITTTAASGIDYPDSIITSTQTITWSYNMPRPSIAGGNSATLTFVATSSNGSGTYCNSTGVTIQGTIGVVARDNLACVNITWPVYQIESHVGGVTIIVRVRMEPSGPVILSWEIRP